MAKSTGRTRRANGDADPFWNEKRNSFIFSRLEDRLEEFKEFLVYDTTSRVVRRLARVGRLHGTMGTADGFYCAVTRDDLVCVEESTAGPARLSAYDLDSGRRRTLVDPNAIIRKKLSYRVERVSTDASLGDTAFGYVVLPPGMKEGERYPLVIVPYVCNGFLKGGTGEEYPIFPLASHGMVVFCLNWPMRDARGWADWERERAAAGLPSRYPNRQLEKVQGFIDQVVADLGRRGLVDTTKIGITGLSAGAAFVSYSLARGANYAAAIMSSGAGDPLMWHLSAPASWDMTGHPFPTVNPDSSAPGADLWKERSIALNAARIDVPLLINASDHEYLTALQTAAAYRHTGKPFELWVYTGDYHVKWQPAHRLAIYKRNLDWFGVWLQGRTGAAPVNDLQQFERWQGMEHD